MSTIAILSDIHANVVALDAVLAELDVLRPDGFVCLGDVAATGPAPSQVMERLVQRDWRIVRGNCDDAMLRFAAGTDELPDGEHDEIDRWCTEQLSAQQIAFMATFEPVVASEAGGVAVCGYHGSPRSNLDEILPGTPDSDLTHWLFGQLARIYAGGHTHVQMARRYREALVINPGSVGLPFTETAGGIMVNPFWAEYAVLHLDGGRTGVELHRTPVDRAAFEQMVAGSGMPHRGWWSGDWTEINEPRMWNSPS
jgi:predicted phosphodiesterase